MYLRNNEHVDLVRELVQSRIEKEEIETELVRYKMLLVHPLLHALVHDQLT